MMRKPIPRRAAAYASQPFFMSSIAVVPPPQGHKRWTLQLLADRPVTLKVVDSLSYETVRRTLKKTS